MSHPVSVSIQLILIMNSALVRNLLTLYIVGDLNIAHHTARRPLLGFASAVVTVCHLLKAAASTKRPIRLAPQRSYSCLHRQLKWKKKKVTLFFFLLVLHVLITNQMCRKPHWVARASTHHSRFAFVLHTCQVERERNLFACAEL